MIIGENSACCHMISLNEINMLFRAEIVQSMEQSSVFNDGRSQFSRHPNVSYAFKYQ